MSLKCELVANSDAEHLQQIYTGFSLLHRQEVIKLKQTIPAKFRQNRLQTDRWDNYEFLNTEVIVNNRIRICYDTHDWNWIDEEILGNVNFYFKRSYDADFISNLKEKDKIFPLGLNYQVISHQTDLFRLQRAAFFQGKDRIKHIIKSLRLDKFLKNKETGQLDEMEAAPALNQNPRVLFMARAWNTEELLDTSQKEKVEEINIMRAESVRALRETFGEKFFGGLMRDDFSEKYFKDVLLPDESLSNKKTYLEILRNFPICVATTGLNNSIGWKFAEYVAFSKAIISEPLKFQLPGDFTENKNYLKFTNSEELVNAVSQLFEDENLRQTMMKNNFDYYCEFVRPDKLVLNTLKIVATQSKISL